jgi:hypothetical protein
MKKVAIVCRLLRLPKLKRLFFLCTGVQASPLLLSSIQVLCLVLFSDGVGGCTCPPGFLLPGKRFPIVPDRAELSVNCTLSLSPLLVVLILLRCVEEKEALCI